LQASAQTTSLTTHATTSPRRPLRLILDIGGDSSLSGSACARPQGTLVIVGGEGGGRLDRIDRQIRAHALSPIVSQKLGTFVAKENSQDLLSLNTLIESGRSQRSSTGPTAHRGQ